MTEEVKLMLKWLDIYWELHPDNDQSHIKKCPVCKDNTGDECWEAAWDTYEKHRKNVEAMF